MEPTEKKIKLDLFETLEERTVENAWMLDYIDKTDLQWIRLPFLTWNQVTRILNNLASKKMHNRFNMIQDETVKDVDWRSVRIHSERELDVMVDEDGKEEDPYPDVKNYKFVPECTKREYLFGTLYQSMSEHIRTGETDPSLIHGWDVPKDHLWDYDRVIKDLREIYPDGIDWDDYDAEMSSYEDETEGSKPALSLVSDNV